MIGREQEELSVYWAISPIYCVVRIFGLAPYSLEVKQNGASWRVSRISLLYSMCALALVLLCIVPMSQHIQHKLILGRLDKIAMYSDIFRSISAFIISLICMILTLINRHKTCILINDLNDFDLNMTSLGIRLNFEKSRKKIIIFLVVWCLVQFISVVVHFIQVEFDEESTLYRISSILLFIVFYLTIVQFIGFVLLLHAR